VPFVLGVFVCACVVCVCGWVGWRDIPNEKIHGTIKNLVSMNEFVFALGCCRG